MPIGPVQLVIFGFDSDKNFHGQIRRELAAVRGRGVIRLIEAIVVRKDAAGQLTVLSDGDATDEDLAAYGAALRRLAGFGEAGSLGDRPPGGAPVPPGQDGVFGMGSAELRAVCDEMRPGTALALALFEHAWAASLSAEIREAGGQLLAQGMLTREAVMIIGAELEAIAAAEAAIAQAEAIKTAALLDALAFTAEAEELETEAANRAVAAVAGEEVATAVAAATLRTLVVAGLIDDAEAGPALDALMAAGLLAPSIVEETLGTRRPPGGSRPGRRHPAQTVSHARASRADDAGQRDERGERSSSAGR